jgi:hypothetical protein
VNQGLKDKIKPIMTNNKKKNPVALNAGGEPQCIYWRGKMGKTAFPAHIAIYAKRLSLL